MLYAFDPLPACNDPITLQEQFLSNNLTLDDCLVQRRKFISGRIYFAATIFNAFFIIITTLLYIFCALDPSKNRGSSSSIELHSKGRLQLVWKRYSLQKKSIACATLGAVGHLIFSTCVFAAQAFNPLFACYFMLYGTVIGFYTWMFAFCTRAYRLRYLYRINQFKVKYSRMSDEEKLSHLKDKTYRWYVTHNQKDLGKVLRKPFLIYAMSLILILAITVPSQQHAIQVLHRCDPSWGACILLGMFGFFIAILTPSITYLLRDNPDAHGIRTELWIIAFIGFPLFLLYTIFFFKLSPLQSNAKLYMRRVFAPANCVLFFTAFAHMISIVVPLLQYIPIRIRVPKYFFKKRNFRTNSSTENFDIGRLAPRQVSSLSAPLELTMECLERTLMDPYMMSQLQEYAIRDFSSENLLFYEKLLQLEEKVKNEAWRSNNQIGTWTNSHSIASSQSDTHSISEKDILTYPIPEKLLTESVELYESFIRENASFQVNISYKARTTIDQAFQELYRKYPRLIPHKNRSQKQPDCLYNTMIPLWDEIGNPSRNGNCEQVKDMNGDIPMNITLGLFETARVEVCWNVFNSVYPKLIEQNG